MCAGLACYLSGCSVTQGYPGPRRPRDEVARISRTLHFWLFAAKIIELRTIDGEWVKGGEIEVLPGIHTVAVSYFSDVANFVQWSNELCSITLDMKAGHSYQANGEFLLTENAWHCWVEDAETGERVEGVFYPRPEGSEPAAGSFW